MNKQVAPLTKKTAAAVSKKAVDAALNAGTASSPSETRLVGIRNRDSLSTKLIFLTVLFVLIAEVLIFVPSVANFRINWLKERLATAEIASIVFISVRQLVVAPNVQTQVLAATSADAIVVRENGESRLLARSSMPPAISKTVNLVDWNGVAAIGDAMETLFATETSHCA